MTLGLTHPLTEISTMNLPGGKKLSMHRTNILAAICELNVSTSRDSKGLHGLYRETTNLMQHDPSSEANTLSVRKELPEILLSYSQ
jgi:hypothetical protein